MLPDMTLYSMVGVAQRLNAASRGEQISNSLFGTPYAGLNHDFPSHLNAFCRLTGYAFGNQVELAMNTTVLPYFLRFRPARVHSEALTLMAGESVEQLKYKLGLPAGPSGASMPLRFCEECADTDTQAHGFAYWHRYHQLPGVLICQHHLIPLQQSTLRLDGRGRSCLYLPDDDEIQCSATAISPGKAKSILDRLAKLSAAALDHDLPGITSVSSFQDVYTYGLKQQGLLTASGRIRATEFVNRLSQQYRTISCFPPFDRIVGKASIEGMLRLVRKPRGCFHTACHLLLIDFLFGSWDLFAAAYRWEQQMELAFSTPAGDEHSVRQNLTRNTEPESDLRGRLMTMAARYRNGNSSLSALAKEIGTDVNTAMRWLGKLGLLDIPRRPHVLTTDIRAKILESLKRGEPLRDIARITGLSRSTVDRICNEQPGIQAQWREANKEWKRQRERRKFEAVIQRNPMATVQELRQTKGSGYSWLSRNDHEWLKASLPKTRAPRRTTVCQRKSRVDWNARDRECLLALEVLESTITFESWERLGPKALLRRLPRLSFVPRLDRLPQSDEKISSLLIIERKRRTDSV